MSVFALAVTVSVAISVSRGLRIILQRPSQGLLVTIPQQQRSKPDFRLGLHVLTKGPSKSVAQTHDLAFLGVDLKA